MTLDTASIRAEFPLLRRELAGEPLTYLDNASTTPRSRRVIEAVRRFCEDSTANVHRGVHPLAAEASEAFESARHAAAAHIGGNAAEIVFTRGTTESINLVASSLELEPDDEIVVTLAEHHSNSLPWRARSKLVALPSNDDGTPRWDQLERVLTKRTRLVAVHHASNVLGTIAPLAELARVAKRHGVPVLVDGAQGAGHLRVDVAALGCEFYALSAHKLGGPGGVGVLFAKSPWLERLVPYQYGGGMVASVSDTELELRDGPHRFEAGTPNVEGVLGFGAALAFLREVGMTDVERHGRELAHALLAECATLRGVRVLGDTDAERIPVVSLVLEERGLDAETLARTLGDTRGVLVSAGRHCAHTLHDHTRAQATLRISAWLVNDLDDIAKCFQTLRPLVS